MSGLGTSIGPILGATFILLLEEFATVFTPVVIQWFPNNAGGVWGGYVPAHFWLAWRFSSFLNPVAGVSLDIAQGGGGYGHLPGKYLAILGLVGTLGTHSILSP